MVKFYGWASWKKKWGTNLKAGGWAGWAVGGTRRTLQSSLDKMNREYDDLDKKITAEQDKVAEKVWSNSRAVQQIKVDRLVQRQEKLWRKITQAENKMGALFTSVTDLR